jgi:hypothetical protein
MIPRCYRLHSNIYLTQTLSWQKPLSGRSDNWHEPPSTIAPTMENTGRRVSLLHEFVTPVRTRPFGVARLRC